MLQAIQNTHTQQKYSTLLNVINFKWSIFLCTWNLQPYFDTPVIKASMDFLLIYTHCFKYNFCPILPTQCKYVRILFQCFFFLLWMLKCYMHIVEWFKQILYFFRRKPFQKCWFRYFQLVSVNKSKFCVSEFTYYIILWVAYFHCFIEIP